MHKIIKEIFVTKYWWNIVQTDDGFTVVNTQMKENKVDRDGGVKTVAEFKTLEEAEKFLDNDRNT